MLKKKKKIIKKILIYVVLIIATYFILYPIVPRIEYWLYQGISSDERVEDHRGVEKRVKNPDEEDSDKAVVNSVDDNRLVIQDINVDIKIVEGSSEEVLSLGAWRRPGSSTPDKGGNTVITAHRFQYTPPNNKTFYNLDKLEVGDSVIVYWENEQYIYEVYESFVVEPEDVEIEMNTVDSILTLYTCTPIWTASKRLVVRGRLVN